MRLNWGLIAGLIVNIVLWALIVMAVARIAAASDAESVETYPSIHSVDFYRGIQAGVYLVPATETGDRIGTRLMAAGWYGDPNDGMECLYAPYFDDTPDKAV